MLALLDICSQFLVLDSFLGIFLLLLDFLISFLLSDLLEFLALLLGLLSFFLCLLNFSIGLINLFLSSCLSLGHLFLGISFRLLDLLIRFNVNFSLFLLLFLFLVLFLCIFFLKVLKSVSLLGGNLSSSGFTGVLRGGFELALDG